ncbi:hypothetical protein [Zunongwangia sp.]|uniref:hypothetical protein n=1 Tax=Zunongwangia sp. TaxID=1965325 RepID=UPI003AA8CC9F
MGKATFIIVSVLILSALVYLAIAVLKITIGLIILAVAAVLLIIIWYKIKHRWEDHIEKDV